MKKEFSFSGEILVASKQLADGPFKWIATYSNKNNKVDVIAFDCDTKAELLDKIKELIFAAEGNGADEQTLATLKAYGEQLANLAYHKEIPQSLLSAIRRNFPLVTRENTIYLSGIIG